MRIYGGAFLQGRSHFAGETQKIVLNIVKKENFYNGMQPKNQGKNFQTYYKRSEANARWFVGTKYKPLPQAREGFIYFEGLSPILQWLELAPGKSVSSEGKA